MSHTASPLDQNPKAYALVKEALEKGDGPSTIAARLEEIHGVTTTKDSIRRFRERHGIKVKKSKKSPIRLVLPTTEESTVLERSTSQEGPLFQYSIISQEGGECITVFALGHPPRVADSTHPKYSTIVAKAKAGDISVLKLFDIAETVRNHFERLSERVLVRNGHIFFDGDELDNSLTQHILRFIDQDEKDWKPLVAFLEKVQDNPVPHSREQLYRWLSCHDFSITEDGNIVAYKGVKHTTDGDGWLSTHSGHAIVDGEEINGYIPNRSGSTVEMPRSEVVHDPSASCSYGLHIGTFNYAQGYGSVVLEVHVNPRDVVSVPINEDQKARTCRYEIIGEIDEPYEAALVLTKSYDER